MIRPSKENKSRCKQQQQAQTKTSADRQPGGSNGTGAQKKKNRSLTYKFRRINTMLRRMFNSYLEMLERNSEEYFAEKSATVSAFYCMND